jgi:hypothetical protein
MFWRNGVLAFVPGIVPCTIQFIDSGNNGDWKNILLRSLPTGEQKNG